MRLAPATGALLSFAGGAWGALAPRQSNARNPSCYVCPFIDSTETHYLYLPAVDFAFGSIDTLSCEYDDNVTICNYSTIDGSPIAKNSSPTGCQSQAAFASAYVCPSMIGGSFAFTASSPFDVGTELYCVFNEDVDNACTYNIYEGYALIGGGYVDVPCPVLDQTEYTCANSVQRRRRKAADDNFTAMKAKKRALMRAAAPEPTTARPMVFSIRRHY